MGADSFPRPTTKSEQVPALRERLSQEVLDIYARYGQGVPSESDAAKISQQIEALPGGVVLLEHICELVEDCRETKSLLQPGSFSTATRFRLKNFEGIKFCDLVSGVELANANLQGANLSGASIVYSNLSGANLTGAEMRHTNFYNSVLDTVKMPTITIDGEELDLLTKQITVPDDDTWLLHKTSLEVADTCSDCEHYNRGVITEPLNNTGSTKDYARRGVLFFQNDQPLGVMKLKGEKTFMALRTVRTSNGEAVFHKGMVYALEPEVREWLTMKSREHYTEDSWRRVDVENMRTRRISTLGSELRVSLGGRTLNKLGRNNLRFISYADMYEEMDRLIERIENHKEPMVDMLKKRSFFSL